MPFRPPSDGDVQRAVDAFLAASANHPLDATSGPNECPADITFTQIEQLSHRLGKQLARRLTEQALERSSNQRLSAVPACLPRHSPSAGIDHGRWPTDLFGTGQSLRDVPMRFFFRDV